MSSLSLRERRLVALLILFVMIAAVYWLVITPIVGGFADRAAERDRLTTTLQHNARLIADIPMLTRRVELQRADRSRFALAAPTPLVAADRLKERLGNLLTASGGELRGIEDSTAGSSWVGASVDAQLTLEQLTAFLSALQNQPPYLVVTNMTIVADRAFQSGKLDVMDVKIDVAIPYTRAA